MTGVHIPHGKTILLLFHSFACRLGSGWVWACKRGPIKTTTTTTGRASSSSRWHHSATSSRCKHRPQCRFSTSNQHHRCRLASSSPAPPEDRHKWCRSQRRLCLDHPEGHRRRRARRQRIHSRYRRLGVRVALHRRRRRRRRSRSGLKW